jgi:Flp pilus assembly protein TadG
MRLTTPNTERLRQQRQQGQALVLIALCMLVLMGFLGLAVDGGHAYWERRILQNAVDAAALSASDNYQDSVSIQTSNQSGAVEYAANERIYGTASASPSWTASSLDVTWSGSSDKLHIVSSVSGPIATFDMSSSHQVPLAFMSALGMGSTITVGATAQGRARAGGTSGSGLVTLSTGNCSGGSPSLQINGGATITVTGGNVQVNGSVSLPSGAVNVLSGSFKDNCTNPVPANVTASGAKTAGVAPVIDPGFPPGPLASWSVAQTVGANVTLNPGTYATDPGSVGGSCWFLAAGVYQWNAGINENAGYYSNSLRPPDEAAWVAGAPDYNSNVSNPQWWGAPCSGSFSVANVASAPGLPTGSWGVILTSTRIDYYPSLASGGTAYSRESAPSTCHAATVAAGQGVQVTVNNVPGATGYNVYMNYRAAGGSACAAGGPWGYVGNIPNAVVETQASRGTVSATFNMTQIPIAPTSLTIGAACVGATTANCAAATGQFGAANPPGDGGEKAPLVAGSFPPGVPAQDVPTAGGGDRANEHYCMPAGTLSSSPCANATVTPGAVQFYFKAGSCFAWITNASMRIFSGIQYNWMAIYAPLANTCGTQISDSASVVVIGTYYWPGGVFNTNGNPGYLIYFTQIVVSAYASNGNENLTISYDVATTAPQGFSQIAL